MNSEIKTALKKYQAAAKQLSEKIKKSYPEGSIVCIIADVCLIPDRKYKLRVTDNFWWQEPDRITGISIKTGKRLTFNLSEVKSIEIVEDEE